MTISSTALPAWASTTTGDRHATSNAHSCAVSRVGRLLRRGITRFNSVAHRQDAVFKVRIKLAGTGLPALVRDRGGDRNLQAFLVNLVNQVLGFQEQGRFSLSLCQHLTLQVDDFFRLSHFTLFGLDEPATFISKHFNGR